MGRNEQFDILRCEECGKVFESYMADEDACILCGSKDVTQLYAHVEIEEEYWENHRERKGKEAKEK